MLSKTRELRSRSIVKGLTWRVIATGTTMYIVYLATGNLELVAGVGAADMMIKLFFYYAHERAWGHIAWGKSVPRT